MPYKINNYYHAKAKIAELQDDYSLPWNSYPCLDWDRGATGPPGFKYGTARLPAPRANEPHVKIHRLAYETVYGHIPDGQDACHHCDRPICYRPIHLFASSAKGNIQDMLSKGRNNHPKGERHRSARLTESQVVEIRALYRSGLGYTEIGKRFDATRSLIYLVVSRRSWAHVP